MRVCGWCAKWAEARDVMFGSGGSVSTRRGVRWWASRPRCDALEWYARVVPANRTIAHGRLCKWGMHRECKLARGEARLVKARAVSNKANIWRGTTQKKRNATSALDTSHDGHKLNSLTCYFYSFAGHLIPIPASSIRISARSISMPTRLIAARQPFTNRKTFTSLHCLPTFVHFKQLNKEQMQVSVHALKRETSLSRKREANSMRLHRTQSEWIRGWTGSCGQRWPDWRIDRLRHVK